MHFVVCLTQATAFDMNCDKLIIITIALIIGSVRYGSESGFESRQQQGIFLFSRARFDPRIHVIERSITLRAFDRRAGLKLKKNGLNITQFHCYTTILSHPEDSSLSVDACMLQAERSHVRSR
jgi:hypothetical protein